MTKFKITQEIIDYINENSINFQEIQPSPVLGEEWMVKQFKTYLNVNHEESVCEAEREDGCFMRIPEKLVSHYTVDNENDTFANNNCN